jgi:hypothetical protein
MLIQGFPPKEADNYLWKNFNDAKFQKPLMNGVHGGNWAPPLASPGNGGFKIASPVPKAKVNKIIAKDLPSSSISGSSFDLPKRKDVVQIGLPTSRQKTIQYEIDPNKKNTHFGKTSYFGSKRMITPKPIGLKRFLQVELSPSKINEVKNDALTAAQTVENKAASLTSLISKNPLANSMIIPIVTTNKQEQPSLKINYKNVIFKLKLENLIEKKEGFKKLESFFEIKFD